jgi:protein SCO1/2
MSETDEPLTEPVLRPPMPHRYAIPLFLIFASLLFLGAEVLSKRLHPAVADTIIVKANNPLPGNMPSFALHDQDNKIVDERQLLGHVWIADFIFTQCDDACLVLNRHVIALEHARELDGVQFLSFSADATDGPPALKRYIEQRFPEADQSRWRLLAADAEQYPRLAVTRGLADRVEDVHDGFIAISQSFYLVDSGGHVCGTYDGLDDNEIARLRVDAAKLIKNRRNIGRPQSGT